MAGISKTPKPVNATPWPKLGPGFAPELAQSKVVVDAFGVDRAYKLLRLSIVARSLVNLVGALSAVISVALVYAKAKGLL